MNFMNMLLLGHLHEFISDQLLVGNILLFIFLIILYYHLDHIIVARFYYKLSKTVDFACDISCSKGDSYVNAMIILGYRVWQMSVFF